MGLFSKAKQSFADAANANAHAAAYQQQQAAGAQAGQIGVSGMMADPAAFGGPSTKPLDPDDPLLQPVNGISIEVYGQLSQEAQARGITDADGMGALAEELHGIPAAEAKAAFDEWTRRMGQSMVVGQQIRKAMGY